MQLAGIGAVVGICISLAATRLMSSMLYEIQPTDPMAFTGAAVFLLLATALAAYVPARRAAKVDPLVGLRYE
jgi:ABC-type antimicrobial peptide transport system permease subunit